MRSVIALLLFFTLGISYGQKFTNEAIFRLNSVFDELDPVLSPDGSTLYFTTANHPDNIAGKRDPGDIWYSKWDGNTWSTPRHAGSELNDRTYNAVAGFSADGKQIFLLNHFDHSGNTARTQGISVSSNSGSGWSKPQNIAIPYFQNKSRLLSGTMSADGRAFVFSAETYGTLGVDDLYVSLLHDGQWSEPKNLGSTINTQFQELSPSLSADGQTLFFSSNGRKGAGSFDVYAATRLDDSWTSWSNPVNLQHVNSEGRELFYRELAGLDIAIFTSTKNSDGYGDIKLAMPDQPVNTNAVASLTTSIDTVGEVEVLKQPAIEKRPNDKVKVYGYVRSSKTGEPLAATIFFAGPMLQQDESSTASADGYAISIPAAGSYTVKIEASGYISTLEKLDIHELDSEELEMNFTLQPVEVGTTVNLKSVLFAQTKTELLQDSYDELDLVASFLKANPHVKIELAGHTDNRGVHEDNVRLSQQRVNTVKAYLVSRGIDSKRITGKGYGGTKPIASNDTEETRKMNRRVEFTIKKSK
jgi:OmpA-OmpF porin, OOP family